MRRNVPLSTASSGRASVGFWERYKWKTTDLDVRTGTPARNLHGGLRQHRLQPAVRRPRRLATGMLSGPRLRGQPRIEGALFGDSVKEDCQVQPRPRRRRPRDRSAPRRNSRSCRKRMRRLACCGFRSRASRSTPATTSELSSTPSRRRNRSTSITGASIRASRPVTIRFFDGLDVGIGFIF